jgi:hypothetical protein
MIGTNTLISILSIIFLITSVVLTGFNMGSVDVEERKKFNLANLIFISLTIFLTIVNTYINTKSTTQQTIVSAFGKMLGKKGEMIKA